MKTKAPTKEQIRALATVTLDAKALDELSPRTMDRLADLVAERLAERQSLGDEPLLTATEAGRAAGVHPETIRRAIRSGALSVAGHVGHRPRLRRADLEAWIAGDLGLSASQPGAVRPAAKRGGRAASSERVLGDALRLLTNERPRP